MARQNNMFELNQAIADWRRQMAADGIKNPALLDELEGHLQDDIERQSQGADMAQTFQEAVRRLGQSSVLTSEFAKVGETNDFFARLKYFFLTLSGIQQPVLATNMNTSSPNRNVEPAWATYVKSGTFVLPAALLWLFVAVYVFPKFNEVLSGSWVWMPGYFHVGWNFALLLRHYLFPICIAVPLAIGLLEWRSANWRRYRKLALATGVFLLNSAVLITITAMVVLSVVAASLSAHP